VVSASPINRSEEFLKISGQFKLGALVTEASHPVTANLSEVAKQDIAAALKLLFDVDDDVIHKFREFVESGRAVEIKETVLRSLKNGGRIFFTGCGSTGRLSILLDSVWRDFWRKQRGSRGNEAHSEKISEPPHVGCYENLENRTFSVMAGGDYALIKSVEGFEDFTAFGKKQIADLNVSAADVVFAITEGGETSFVIGTAWQGVEAGAKVYFVYNNPDEILCEHVERSREVIQDERIEKINLTTGPMAITGSTRMQATSIQLCVMLTILEMAARDLLGKDSSLVPKEFLARLVEMHATLKSPVVLAQLAKLVALEESVYRAGHKINYLANSFGIDVLTDTTERSPTFCTPPFRKADDTTAAASWAFLFLPQMDTPFAWGHILKRPPRCVEWNEAEVRALVGDEKLARMLETIRKISTAELMRFKIGWNDISSRPLGGGDGAIAVMATYSKVEMLSAGGFFRLQLDAARRAGAKTGFVFFGCGEGLDLTRAFAAEAGSDCASVLVPVSPPDFLLDGVKRVGVKLLMNALSTCTMVRLGRIMGNTMIYVVPSNLKLIDRATRYITRLTDLNYEQANQLLFEIIEYVEPRMKSDQAYPPVVGMAVLRAKHQLTNEAAEQRLLTG
jgi:N-acetylmuramic acid 6-phosphate etherase